MILIELLKLLVAIKIIIYILVLYVLMSDSNNLKRITHFNYLSLLSYRPREEMFQTGPEDSCQ